MPPDSTRPEPCPPILATAARIVFDSPVATALCWSPSFQYLGNAAFCTQMGVDPELSAGRPARDAWPTLLSITEPLLQAGRLGESGLLEEVRLPGSDDDTERWASCSVAPVRDEAGDVAGVLLHVFDVTARVVERRRRQASEERLALALEAADLGTWNLDLTTDTAAVRSVRHDQMFGYSTLQPEWGQEVALRHVLPEDRERFGEAFAAAAAMGVLAFEVRVRWPDGSVHWIAPWGRTYYDDSGRPVRMAGVVADVTNRKEAEQEREALYQQLADSDAETRLNLARLQAVLEALPVGVFITDASGAINVTNSAARAIWGGVTPLVNPESYEQYVAWNVQTGEPVDHEDWPLVRALRTGKPCLNMELEIKAFDGTRRIVLASGLVFRDDAGTVVGGVVVNVDVTADRRTEAMLRVAHRMEAVGRLAGGVAHDFNNMLTVIIGHAEMLRDGRGDVTDREHLKEIITAAERSTKLTRQLLAYGRRQVLQPKVLDLSELASGVTSMLHRLIGEHIEIRMELGSALPPVYADPGQLEQVLVNLAVNARDAMPRGGTLTIRTRAAHLDASHPRAEEPDFVAGRHVVMEVIDTGTGMEAAVLSQIFEPFFTTKGPGEGTGLGLSMAYGLVKQSGGNLWVTSAPGEGSTFALYLPMVEREAPESELAAAVREPPPRGAETILLVEDEAAVRALAGRVLRQAGYTVLIAATGKEALELATSHAGAIHLVLSDVVMPRMSGNAMIELLPASLQGIPALFMSGYAEEIVEQMGTPGRTVHFLQKPFTTSELLRRVRESLKAVR